MKKLILILLGAMLFTGCVSYHQIGDLTMISNRNVDSKGKYVLIKRGAEGYAKEESNDALERAIDDACKKYAGEYMMNVKIYVKDNGMAVKVVGDVWGRSDSKFFNEHTVKTGAKVVFKRNGGLKKGVVLGIKDGKAIVEYTSSGKKRQVELDVEKLTVTNE